MKKLKLVLNDLKVESFETNKISNNRGTVNGQEVVNFSYLTECYSCYRHSCVNTCGGATCETSWCVCDYV